MLIMQIGLGYIRTKEASIISLVPTRQCTVQVMERLDTLQPKWDATMQDTVQLRDHLDTLEQLQRSIADTAFISRAKLEE